MTERELLEKIIQNQEEMRSDISTMKSEMSTIKSEMSTMKSDIADIRSDISSMNEKIVQIDLHLENVTDKNIILLAENYINLTRKLDENNKVTDTQSAYQIKVDYLSEEVKVLKKEVAELKNRIA